MHFLRPKTLISFILLPGSFLIGEWQEEVQTIVRPIPLEDIPFDPRSVGNLKTENLIERPAPPQGVPYSPLLMDLTMEKGEEIRQEPLPESKEKTDEILPPSSVPEEVELLIPARDPSQVEEKKLQEEPIPAPIPPAAPPVPAPAPVPAPQKLVEEVKPPQTFLIKFNNVKMPVVLGFISKITNKNFIFDEEELDFKVSIVSSEPTTIENTIAALLQELRVRGLQMIEVGNNFIIHKNPAINSPATLAKEGDADYTTNQIITQVFKLKYVDPSNVVGLIKPMLSENSIVEAMPNSRNLIITGLANNLSRIADLLNSLDSPSASIDIGQYQAKNIPITQAIEIVDKLIQPLAKDQPLVLSAHTQLNTVYISSTPSMVEKVIDVFKKIDRYQQGADLDEFGLPIRKEGTENTGDQGETSSELGVGRFATQGPIGQTKSTRFYLHKLQYRKGDQIQTALQQIALSLQQTSIETTDLISTIQSIQWIESSNSLVLTGTAESIASVKELIDEIDTVLPQVLIEMLVLDVTLDDALNFGVEWGSRFSQHGIAGAESFMTQNSPINTVLNNPLGLNTLDPAPMATQAGFNLGVMGRNVTFGGMTFSTMAALIKSLHTDAKDHIVLNPKIVVEDNTPASIFVGINTAFQTQAIANDQGSIVTSNFEFRDVGSTLKVTPLIGNNGIITLDIEQEISDVVLTTLSSGTSSNSNLASTGSVADQLSILNSLTNTNNSSSPGPTTRKNKTTTRIHVPDKFFVVLSGQIRTETVVTRTQVPCLGGIPFMGALFTQKRNIEQKRNLMLFIRPQILNIQDLDPVTKRQQDLWKEKERTKNSWNYEVDETLDYLNLRHDFSDPERRY